MPEKVNSMDFYKKAIKTSYLTVVAICVALVLQKLFTTTFRETVVMFVESLFVVGLASAVYLIKMPDRAKGFSIILIPTIANAAIILIKGHSLNSHYMLMVGMVMTAMYFDTWMIPRMAVVYNLLQVALYVISPVKLNGAETGITTIVFELFCINSFFIIMYLMAKWGNEFLNLSMNKERAARRIVVKLEEFTKKVADGDIEIQFDPDDEDVELNKTLSRVIDSIKGLKNEIKLMANSALNGDLSKRGQTEQFRGSYKEIIEGINNTIDALLEPVKECTNVLQIMSTGNLQVRMQGNYKGDNAIIKNALNNALGSFGEYVSETSRVLYEMANKNLSVSINGDFKGDFSEIKNSLNHIQQSFNKIINEINTVSGRVALEAKNVSEGSTSLAQGATEQASSIHELSKSMLDMTSQTKRNADNANEAKTYSDNVKKSAEAGNERMKEMLVSMDEIKDASSNIAKIVKVINDIAFQTNILALNAAVEASRAGYHGKGFAVVAEEVRRLALKSSEAVMETTEYIENSIRKVESGIQIANETADALSEIVSISTKTANLVADISDASNNQANGISQINVGVEQVSIVIHKNAETANLSAAASEKLTEQANFLKEQISEFKLDLVVW